MFANPFSTYVIDNTPSTIQNSHWLVLLRKIIAFCSDSHSEHIDTRVDKVQNFVMLEVCGAYSNHWAVQS